MGLPQNFKQQLVTALKARGAKSECELCQRDDWTIVDQAVSIQITDLSGSWTIPPPQIPAAGLICNNCGNIRLFAFGALGLLPTPTKEGQK
jgi:hypothetical protein